VEAGKVYNKSKDIVTREIEGEVILVPVVSEAPEMDSIYVLNETSAFIWNLLDGKNSLDNILDRMTNTYEVTRERARKDIEDFINTLLSFGALEEVRD